MPASRKTDILGWVAKTLASSFTTRVTCQCIESIREQIHQDLRHRPLAGAHDQLY